MPHERHQLLGREPADSLGAGELDLFGGSRADAASPIVDTLRAVDVDRLTPLDALNLVVKLRALLPR